MRFKYCVCLLFVSMANVTYAETSSKGIFNGLSHDLGRELVDDGSFCPDQNRQPWEISRAEYLSRATMQKCSQAFIDMKNFEYLSKDRIRSRMMSSRGIYIDPSSASISGFQLEQVGDETYPDSGLRMMGERVFRNYAQSCIRTIENLTTPDSEMDPVNSNLLRRSSSNLSIEALVNSIGLLSREGATQQNCSGALVNLSHGVFLVTGMHCLGPVRSDGEDSILDAVYSDLIFETFSGLKLEVSVSEDLINTRHIFDREDIAAAMVSVPPNYSVIDMVSLPIEAWESIMIIGLNAYLNTFEFLDGLRGIDLLRASIAVETGADCFARASHVGRLSYTCQTARRMSGAPIIVYREGEYMLAGVHLGDIGIPNVGLLECSLGYPKGGVNRGLSIRFP